MTPDSLLRKSFQQFDQLVRTRPTHWDQAFANFDDRDLVNSIQIIAESDRNIAFFSIRRHELEETNSNALFIPFWSCVFIEAIRIRDESLKQLAISFLFDTDYETNVLFIRYDTARLLVYYLILFHEPDLFEPVFTAVYYINYVSFGNLAKALFRMNGYTFCDYDTNNDLASAISHLSKCPTFQAFVRWLTPPIQGLRPLSLSLYDKNFQELYKFSYYVPLPHQADRERFTREERLARRVVVTNILEEHLSLDVIKYVVYLYLD